MLTSRPYPWRLLSDRVDRLSSQSTSVGWPNSCWFQYLNFDPHQDRATNLPSIYYCRPVNKWWDLNRKVLPHHVGCGRRSQPDEEQNLSELWCDLRHGRINSIGRGTSHLLVSYIQHRVLKAFPVYDCELIWDSNLACVIDFIPCFFLTEWDHLQRDCSVDSKDLAAKRCVNWNLDIQIVNSGRDRTFQK